tara:strand:+ start:697 stop:948 length:252 start_codon:yes stop_codon:yes gene_type:complete
MDEEGFLAKATEVLIWLKENEAGALGPVIDATIQAGLTATTDDDRIKFWSSVRSLVSALPDMNSTVVCGFCSKSYRVCECFNW